MVKFGTESNPKINIKLSIPMKLLKESLLLVAIFVSGMSAYSQKKLSNSFIEDFNRHSTRNFRAQIGGRRADFTLKLGLPSASEKETKILSLKTDPGGAPGPGRGPEVISKRFTHFGTYAARLKIPDVRNIQPNTGAVIGYFTYRMDSTPGLSEIDFEWLVADPEIIYIGTWTGPRGSLKRIGRTINLARGIIYNTEYRERNDNNSRPLTGMQNQPEAVQAIEGYDASSRFHTYGFDWYPDRIRWWMIHPASGDTVILWDYSGSFEGIPQNATRYRLNFWHTNNWPVETNPNSTEKPLRPYETEVDWMSYDPFHLP